MAPAIFFQKANNSLPPTRRRLAGLSTPGVCVFLCAFCCMEGCGCAMAVSAAWPAFTGEGGHEGRVDGQVGTVTPREALGYH